LAPGLRLSTGPVPEAAAEAEHGRQQGGGGGEAERGGRVGERVQAGTDLMNLRFGQKVFGHINFF
jgi:hypothetical protein